MLHLDDTDILWKPKCTLEDAEKVILGIPFGSGQIGPSNTVSAPVRIRNFLLSYYWKYDFERKEDLTEKKIYDLGDVKETQSFEAMSKRVEDILKFVLERNPNAKFIILGGEHTVTLPVVKILNPRSLLSLDAHPDFQDIYEDYKYSIACVMKRIHELGCEVNLRGIRAMSKNEHEFLINKNINWSKNLKFNKDVDYLSVDVDVMDPIYVNTAAPETLGFTPKDVIELIRNVNFKHCDLVEWSPDHGYPAVVQILKELMFK